MKITIITASYNAVNTIEQTITSVIEQTYKDIEYIIIDGGSNDGTVDIIKKYDKYISYWCSESDDGIYDALNKGIKIASGDYIQIIGADDCLLDKNTIQLVVDNINVNTDIFSAARYAVSEKYRCQVLEKNNCSRGIKKGVLPWMPHTGLFVRTQYMKENLFDTSYRIAADYKFILNAFLDNTVIFQYVDFPVAYFSLGGVSNRGDKTLKKEINSLFKELNLRENFDVGEEAFDTKLWKKVFKYILDKIDALSMVLCILNIWHKHECDNKKCRWCERV